MLLVTVRKINMEPQNYWVVEVMKTGPERGIRFDEDCAVRMLWNT